MRQRLIEAVWGCSLVIVALCFVAGVCVSNVAFFRAMGVVPGSIAFPDGPPPLTVEEFAKLQSELKKNPELPTSVVSILDFYADWCGPCRAAKPAIDQLERDGYTISRIDIDTADGKEQKRLNNVGPIPTFIVRLNFAEQFRTHDVRELKRKLANLPQPAPRPASP